MRMRNAATTTLALFVGAPSVFAAGLTLTDVPAQGPKIPGFAAPNVLSPELGQEVVAQGSTRLEHGVDGIAHFYGYSDDGKPMLPTVNPPCTQAVGNNCEATKTEPDENTYLVFSRGLDGNLDHGTHFLFQGHESGAPLRADESISGGSTKKGYITRINLDVPSDADGEHRVTLLATKDINGNFLPAFDGSVWDPFLTNPEHPERPGQLLFSAEIGAQGGIWQATPDYPAKVEEPS